MKKFGFLILLTLFACKKQDLDLRGHVTAYENANKRFRSSQAWNESHPARELQMNAEVYKILVAGDCHVGGLDNLSLMFNSAEPSGSQAIFMAGDLTTGKEEDYNRFAQFLLEHDSLPVFLTPGNHDLFYNGWEQYYRLFGSSSYTLVVSTPSAKDLFLILDSGSGTFGEDQKNWLVNVLENQRSDFRNCILITHQNFFRTRFTTSTNPLVEEILFLLELFADYNVNLVITGHEHTSSVEDFGNTTYITLDALEDINDNASWLEVELGPNGGSWNFMEILR